MTYLTTKQN